MAHCLGIGDSGDPWLLLDNDGQHWAIVTSYVVMRSESKSEGKKRKSKNGNRHIPAIVHMPTRSTIPTNPTRAILQSPEYEKGQIDNRTRDDTSKALIA